MLQKWKNQSKYFALKLRLDNNRIKKEEKKEIFIWMSQHQKLAALLIWDNKDFDLGLCKMLTRALWYQKGLKILWLNFGKKSLPFLTFSAK